MTKRTAPTKFITSVSLTEDVIAVLAGNHADGAQWEIYEVRDGLECFSHFATAGEAEQIVDALMGPTWRERLSTSGRFAGLGGPLYTPDVSKAPLSELI